MKTLGGHFRKSGLKVLKSIRFFSKTQRDFAESQNLNFPCETQHFAKTNMVMRYY